MRNSSRSPRIRCQIRHGNTTNNSKTPNITTFATINRKSQKDWLDGHFQLHYWFWLFIGSNSWIGISNQSGHLLWFRGNTPFPRFVVVSSTPTPTTTTKATGCWYNTNNNGTSRDEDCRFASSGSIRSCPNNVQSNSMENSLWSSSFEIFLDWI